MGVFLEDKWGDEPRGLTEVSKIILIALTVILFLAVSTGICRRLDIEEARAVDECVMTDN